LKKFCLEENLIAKYPIINFQINKLIEYATKKMLNPFPNIEKVLGGGKNINKIDVDKNQIIVGKSE